MKQLRNFFLFLLCQLSFTLFAQQERIELIRANELEGSVKDGKNVRILKGNVALKQGNVTVYCETAYQFYEQNQIEAYDKVRITQGDSFSVTGDKLYYDGNTKVAQIRGKEVVLKDSKATLYSQYVDYDMGNKMLKYFNGGRVVDAENTLTSDVGYYYISQKLFTFKDNVALRNSQYTMTSDTLLYNTGTKIVNFKGPTKIISKEGALYAEKGFYNTITKQSSFEGRSKMDYKDYSISADVLDYNQFTGKGLAKNKVIINSFKDSTIVEGELAYYDRPKGYSKVYANALMKNKFENDTLYLKADTLITINDSLSGNRKVFAYHNVRIYHKMMKAKCDSLIFNLTDSILYLYKDPVLWSSGSQILADTIWLKMKTGKINRMYLRKNAFVISSDSLNNYNQVKGRNMLAYFNDSSQIEKIDVKGNGESIYFALEGDTSLIGMNKVQCSDMIVRFQNKKVKTINFQKKPEATFFPPKEIQEPDRRLKGFRWRIAEQPTKELVLAKINYSGTEIPLILPKNHQTEVTSSRKPDKPLTRKEKRALKKAEKN